MQPNYFEFYGIPVALFVDPAAVRRIFLENSRKFHPDFHTLSNPSEQQRALELSTLNNEAFKVLSNPDLRLEYVLQLKGMLDGAGSDNNLPQSFLMEMMDINEKIMELEFEPTPALYQEAVAAVDGLASRLEDEIGGVLHQWTEQDGQEEELMLAKIYYLKKRYLLRIKENLSKFAAAFE